MDNVFQEKVEELKRKVTQANERIKRCEQVLVGAPAFVTAAFGGLTWDAGRKRIMLEGKPLIEHKLGVRIDRQWGAECLVDCALTAAIEAVSESEECEKGA